jgi:hypothetical protein
MTTGNYAIDPGDVAVKNATAATVQVEADRNIAAH